MSNLLTVNGQVVNQNGQAISDVRVEAWDKDLVGRDDFLGSFATDAGGNFSISLTSGKELILDRDPDVYFKVLSGNDELLDTSEKVLSNLKSNPSPITLTITDFDSSKPKNGKVSKLFMISSPEMEFLEKGNYNSQQVGAHFTINQNDAEVLEFTDRPYRLANVVPDGIVGFSQLYAASDFVQDPPNVTFSGTQKLDGQSHNTIVEIGQPFINGELVIVPVKKVLKPEVLPPAGSYTNCSMVVDVLDDVISIGSELLPHFISMFEQLGKGKWSPVTVTFANNSGTTLRGYNSHKWTSSEFKVKDSKGNAQPMPAFSTVLLQNGDELVFDIVQGSGGVFMMASPDPIMINDQEMILLTLFAIGFYDGCCPWSQSVGMEVSVIPVSFWNGFLEGSDQNRHNFLMSWWNDLDPRQLWGYYSKGGHRTSVGPSVRLGDVSYQGSGNIATTPIDYDGNELGFTNGVATFSLTKEEKHP